MIVAAGFLGTMEYVPKAFGTELTSRNCVKTEENKHKLSVEKVFIAGEMHTGQSLVVKAINEGRRYVKEVDIFLMGYTNMT